MKLHQLPKIKEKKSKRIGRGYGSGKGGHTVGRGQKGQRSRKSFKRLKAWIRESKIRSIPKLKGIGKRSARRGYAKVKIKDYVLNVSDLDRFKDGTVVDLSFLKKEGIADIRTKKVSVKILGRGDLARKVTLRGLKVSETARKKIEKAGGKVVG
ncbi:uL15 family ribosomal protein [Candidatus Dojkabacteria bacterium]|nr:uL15 family ribosomal protein [Candidatus Dojkabacteria bacterium]